VVPYLAPQNSFDCIVQESQDFVSTVDVNYLFCTMKRKKLRKHTENGRISCCILSACAKPLRTPIYCNIHPSINAAKLKQFRIHPSMNAAKLKQFRIHPSMNAAKLKQQFSHS
jgi:hypothetical protein